MHRKYIISNTYWISSYSGSELRHPNYIKYYSATRIISFRVFYCWFIGISCSENISFNGRLLTEHKVVGSGLEMEKHNVHNETGNTLEAHKRKSNCKNVLSLPKNVHFFRYLALCFKWADTATTTTSSRIRSTGKV